MTMGHRGGCNLSKATVAAVILSLIESIYGLLWNILVIYLMSVHFISEDEHYYTTDAVTTETAEYGQDDLVIETVRYNVSNKTYEELWEILKSNLRSDLAVREHLYEIVIAALVANALWIITTMALAAGNAEKERANLLKPWIVWTIIITISDIAATVYFTFKAIKDGDDFDFRTSYFTNLFVFFATMFSRGCIIIWIVNITLCVYVARRLHEISAGRAPRKGFNSDFNIMPYSLNPPYSEFETESSTRTSKNFRPNTPPPDYDGKKRRNSLPSDTETMTLPLSVPNSRASLANSRPLSQSSYLYDDRVDLHHRASCAAETVLYHAYENKGLVMESDGWMGMIPRPHLKMPTHH